MRRRVAVVGLPHYAELTAEALRGKGWDARHVPAVGRSPGRLAASLFPLGRAHLVYAIGSSVEVRSPLDMVARLTGAKILMHWVGTDVEYGLKAWSEGTASPRLLAGATHWTDAPWLAEELRPLGIMAKVQQLPGRFSIGEPVPMPDRFRVLTFFPKNPHGAYDVDGTLEVMRALPEVPFALVGGHRLEDVPPNLEVLGYRRDMGRVYAESSGLLRLVRHDGISISVLEALSYGRRVAWNYPFEGVDQVSGVAEAVEVVSQWQAAHDRGELQPERDVAARVREKYDPNRVIEDVSDGLERLLS